MEIFQSFREYIGASKETLSLLKAALELLPKGNERDDAERRIEAAEEALGRSDAKLAKELWILHKTWVGSRGRWIVSPPISIPLTAS